jgi:glyoxylase-like metal-dependent hydrolase (beta-lactamase superfamily II)
MITRQIVNGLYVIPTGSVNTFLIDDPKGCVLIDTGFPCSEDKIFEALQELKKPPESLRHIVLTHAHPDHIGSSAALKQATGAQTYMHPLDAPIARLGTGFRPLHPAPGVASKIMFKLFMRPIDNVEPTNIDHEIEDGETLPIAGGLRVIHVPGHCAGQIALLWPRHGGVLFAADSCMHLMGLGLTIAYEDVALGRRSLQRLAGLEFQVATFGHGRSILRNASSRFKEQWTIGSR